MILDQFLLTDRVAVVTGAGRGIGAAIAVAYAEAGADVVISARTTDQLNGVAERIRSAGRRAVAVAADLTQPAELTGLVTTAVDELGGVDVVVNNIGGSMPGAFLETSADDLDAAFAWNTTTAFRLSRAAVPHMLERGGASIVNITSAMGHLADRGFVAYGTAKAALSHMTVLMAKDLAPKVRVNAIAPGSIATDALSTVLTDELEAEMVRRTPMRRLGVVDDIAAAALYLASDAAAYVTGQVLGVDGGLTFPNLGLGLEDL